MRSLLLLALVACTDVHHVTLLVGTSSSTLSGGFTCPDPDAPGHLLFERALEDSLDFSMLVDFIDLGDQFPSCLAEDVVAACSGSNSCGITVADAPVRFCEEVHIDRAALGSDPQTAIRNYLAENFSNITSEAPHRAVIVRAVATTQACGQLTVTTTAEWPAPAPADVLGCAYSCPVDLDDLDGTLQLGLNLDLKGATAQQCVAAIDACAQFPY